jgi:phospholipase D1/2
MTTRAKNPAGWRARCHTATASAIARSAKRTTRRHSRPAWQKIVPVVVVMLALFLVWRYTPLAEWLTAQSVIAWAREAGKHPWSPVLLTVAYILAAFTMFPRPLLTLLSIIAYGPWLGFGVSMMGIIASAAAVYYAGRALPKGTLHDLGGDKLERVGATLRKHGVLAALAVSIVPVAPFPLVGMTAGAAGIRLWQFLLGVTAGMTPGTLATAIFTDQLLAALDDEGEVNYWIIAAIVLVFAVLIVVVKRWLTKVHR